MNNEKQKAYFTTAKTFEAMRFIMGSGELKISQIKWMKSLYAFAAKNFALTEKQVLVIEGISEKIGVNFRETIVDSGICVQEVEVENGKN